MFNLDGLSDGMVKRFLTAVRVGYICLKQDRLVVVGCLMGQRRSYLMASLLYLLSQTQLKCSYVEFRNNLYQNFSWSQDPASPSLPDISLYDPFLESVYDAMNLYNESYERTV